MSQWSWLSGEWQENCCLCCSSFNDPPNAEKKECVSFFRYTTEGMLHQLGRFPLRALSDGASKPTFSSRVTHLTRTSLIIDFRYIMHEALNGWRKSLLLFTLSYLTDHPEQSSRTAQKTISHRLVLPRCFIDYRLPRLTFKVAWSKYAEAKMLHNNKERIFFL